jgi:murein DD-endopeptidase MepM/ murein hydrolase activator NlpD
MQWAFALYPYCLFAAAVAWVLRTGRPRREIWVLHALGSANVAAFAFLSGAWAFTSIYLGYAALIAYVAALARSLLRERRLHAAYRDRRGGIPLVPAVTLAAFAALNLMALAARVAPAGAIDARFPLGPGTYAVLQGGDSVVTNPFHVASGTPLALDIVKLNDLGNRAAGIAPRALEAYAIFGERVHSPCDGLVARVRDGLADNPPAHPDVANASGNHVVVRCGDAEIMLAHLQKGSIAVTPGLTVRSGDLIGRIGNSGHSMEPHLHIDAAAGSGPLPLVFGGRFLSAGDTVTVTQSGDR